MNLSTITPKSAPAPQRRYKLLPDETELARIMIDSWLALDPEAQDAYLAQLIAATIHDGPDTALGIFAATGRLYADDALTELNEVEVPLEREAWIDALGRYILSRGGTS